MFAAQIAALTFLQESDTGGLDLLLLVYRRFKLQPELLLSSERWLCNIAERVWHRIAPEAGRLDERERDGARVSTLSAPLQLVWRGRLEQVRIDLYGS